MADPALINAGNRWQVVTPNDRSGVLYIVVFLSFTYSSLTFIARCFIKWRVLGLDDAAICAAQVASLVQFALILDSLSHGLAKHIDVLNEDDYTKMASSQFGNQIALYVSLGFSKISTIVLIQRLFTSDMKKAWTMCMLIMLTAAIWTIAATFLVSIGCTPTSTVPKTPSRMCPKIVTRYKAIVIFDAITEILLVVVPSSLFWQLRMPATRKLQVLVIFSFRLPVVALAGLFLKNWVISVSAENPGTHRARALIYQQSELCISLMAATVPCVRGFVRSFDTGSGVKAGIGTSSNDRGSSHARTNRSILKHRETYEMAPPNWNKSVEPHNGSRTFVDITAGSHRRIASSQSEASLTRSEIPSESHGLEHGRQSQDGGRELIIHREMHWEVTNERARKGHSLDNPGMLRLPK